SFHAEDGAVQVDVLPPRELRVKPGSHLEQGADAAANLHITARRLGDARQDLEQGALAGAVAADDSQDLAAFELEGDVVERTEAVLAPRGLAVSAKQGDQAVRELVTQGIVTGLHPHDLVFLRKTFNPDVEVAHRLPPEDEPVAPRRSVAGAPSRLRKQQASRKNFAAQLISLRGRYCAPRP